ncbi:uncharacterized protein LOC141673349 [Apium graveolens]|uniref:uncharacterized protein LOC141673349 n=1 Tax=Apium graveolens TaxID=4045 RepID=UPI003D78F1EB
MTLAEQKIAKDALGAINTLSLGAGKVKMAKAQTLKAEFESLSMKDSENLDNFCMKLNGLDANIRALGETIGEEYVVKKLLKAVPTKFLEIASAIEQFGNLGTMSVEEVIGSLKAHEDRLSGQVNSKEEQLLLTEEEWSKYENNSGKLLLTRDKWLNKSNRGGSQFGNDYHQGRDSQDEVILLIEGVRSNIKEIEENTWYLDNGASNHMTGRRDKFKKLDKSVRGQYALDFGRYLGRGNITSESTISPDTISRTRKGVVKWLAKTRSCYSIEQLDEVCIEALQFIQEHI